MLFLACVAAAAELNGLFNKPLTPHRRSEVEVGPGHLLYLRVAVARTRASTYNVGFPLAVLDVD